MKFTKLFLILVLFYNSIFLANINLESRIKGSIIASALGDAMGKPTEFLSMEQIFTKYPNGIKSFKDFKPNDFWYFQRDSLFSTAKFHRANYNPLMPFAIRIAPFTDDTQMAKMFLEVCLQVKQNNMSIDAAMELLADKFIAWSNDPDGGLCKERAPGNTCLAACKELEKRKKLGQTGSGWWKCGKGDPKFIETEGGCGSVMRAWPAGLVFHDDIIEAEAFAVTQSLLTHRHPKARAACAAMAVGIAMILSDKSVKEVAHKMITTANKYDRDTAALMLWAQEQAELKTDPKIVFDKLRAWAAHEAISAALYTFLVSPNDVHRAIYLGVHTPGDSDSIAAMAGALVGARCGIEQINKNDIQLLEKHDELLQLAKL